MCRIRLWLILMSLGGMFLVQLAGFSSPSFRIQANQEDPGKGDDKKGDDDKGDDKKDDDKKDDDKKEEAKKEEFKAPPPPADNLAIPEDLSERQRDLLTEITQEYDALSEVHPPGAVKNTSTIVSSGRGLNWWRDAELLVIARSCAPSVLPHPCAIGNDGPGSLVVAEAEIDDG